MTIAHATACMTNGFTFAGRSHSCMCRCFKPSLTSTSMPHWPRNARSTTPVAHANINYSLSLAA